MTQARSPFEEEMRSLRRSVEELQLRLEAVEARLATPSAALEARPRSEEAAEQAVEAFSALARSSARTVPLAGRLLVVLGGAYVVRALTEEALVPPVAGVALGLGYALNWLAAALRSARRGDSTGATWHAAGTALIAFPLLWETSARFDPPLLSHAVAAGLLGLVALAGVGVAARTRLKAVATIYALGAALAAHAALLPHADAGAPMTAVLTLVGVATLWVGRKLDWQAPLWITALAADAAALYVLGEGLDPQGAVAPALALALLLGLFLAYVLRIAAGALTGRERLDVFGGAQSALALAVGFGGALWIARDRDVVPAIVAGASLALALAAYVLAFRFLGRGRRRCFHYLTTIALVLVLLASASLLHRPAIPWALLAVATAWLGRRVGRVTLSLHAALYVVAAAIPSGLFALASGGWLAGPQASWPLPALGAWLGLAAAAVCTLLPPRRLPGDERAVPGLSGAVLFLVLAWAGGGLAIGRIADLLTGEGGALDAGILAAVRTGMLALLTVAAALGARTALLAEGRLVVHALLAAGAMKLVLEDLPQGHAATLAVSFVLYGAVLILAPRLARGWGAVTPPEALEEAP